MDEGGGIGALSGIKIIDWSVFQTGPSATSRRTRDEWLDLLAEEDLV